MKKSTTLCISCKLLRDITIFLSSSICLFNVVKRSSSCRNIRIPQAPRKTTVQRNNNTIEQQLHIKELASYAPLKKGSPSMQLSRILLESDEYYFTTMLSNRIDKANTQQYFQAILQNQKYDKERPNTIFNDILKLLIFLTKHFSALLPFLLHELEHYLLATSRYAFTTETTS